MAFSLITQQLKRLLLRTTKQSAARQSIQGASTVRSTLGNDWNTSVTTILSPRELHHLTTHTDRVNRVGSLRHNNLSLHHTLKPLQLRSFNSTSGSHTHSATSSTSSSSSSSSSSSHLLLLALVGSTLLVIGYISINSQYVSAEEFRSDDTQSHSLAPDSSELHTFNERTMNELQEQANKRFITSDELNNPLQTVSFFKQIWNYIYDRLPEWSKGEVQSALPEAVTDIYGRQPRTLVLGWNTVLVATQWTRPHGWRMQARNDAAQFLRRAFESGYEIVVWADHPQADVEQYTQHPAIGGEFIRHRLYYDQMNIRDFKTVKDLTRLGRDLKRVIVIDSNKKFYWLQPDNALIIPKFDGNPEDRELTKLLPVLEKIQQYNVYDVRNIIREYNKDNNANLFAIHEKLHDNAKQTLGLVKQEQIKDKDAALPSTSDKQQGKSWLSKVTGLFDTTISQHRKAVKLPNFNHEDEE